MRGDRPASELSNIFICEFTPHARGSTRRGTKIAPHLCVYPACAGIDRTIGHGLCGPYRLPRMRGDRPLNVKDSDSRQGFTLHARDRPHKEISNMTLLFTRMRGDRPSHVKVMGKSHVYPRMRGDRPSGCPKGGPFVYRMRGSTATTPSRPSGLLISACAGSTYNHLFFHRTIQFTPARGSTLMNEVMVFVASFTPHARSTAASLHPATWRTVYPACGSTPIRENLAKS